VGKSYLLYRILENVNLLFEKPFEKIIYCSPGYKEFDTDENYYNDLKNVCPNIIFISRIITENDIFYELSMRKHVLIILDDFESELFTNDFLSNLYTRLSNHNNISIISVVQNGGLRNKKHFYLIMRSCNSFLIFENRCDKNFAMMLSRKMFPYCKSFIEICLQKAAKILGEYPYVVVDCTPQNSLSRTFPVKTAIIPTSEKNFEPVLFKIPQYD
jgi:hypothetical protein